jgi:hypothetical protein
VLKEPRTLSRKVEVYTNGCSFDASYIVNRISFFGLMELLFVIV